MATRKPHSIGKKDGTMDNGLRPKLLLFDFIASTSFFV
jgi:hypothetical protein